MPSLLLIAALPLTRHDCLELTTRQGNHLHAAMRADGGGKNGTIALKAIRQACGDVLNGPAKLKSLYSAGVRAFVRDIIVLALQEGLTRTAMAHEGLGEANVRTADQLLVIVESLVMSGILGKEADTGPESHQAQMKILASLVRSLVFAAQVPHSPNPSLYTLHPKTLARHSDMPFRKVERSSANLSSFFEWSRSRILANPHSFAAAQVQGGRGRARVYAGRGEPARKGRPPPQPQLLPVQGGASQAWVRMRARGVAAAPRNGQG